jgi:chemotaxis protein MotB
VASAEKPIIIIKKKGGHGGHHGGAWKIAYADFVTAMMAFFMVMWLVNTADSVTKKAIASYFKRPGVFELGSGTPLETGAPGILEDAFAPPQPEEKEAEDGVVMSPRKRGYQEGPLAKGKEAEDVTGPRPGGVKEPTAGGNPALDKRFITRQEELLDGIRSQILALTTPEFLNLLGAVELRLDAEGLTIDIMDNGNSSMFAQGSAQILPEAQKAFEKVAQILSKVPNEIEIHGHTDAKPYSTRPNGYSNWELSTDRANAARRMLQTFGIDPSRIKSVVGKSSTELKVPEDPYAPANRRISIKMKMPTSLEVDFRENHSALENIEEIVKATPTPKIEAAVVTEQVEEHKPAKPTVPAKPEEKDVPVGMPRDKIFGDHPIVGPFGLR